MRVRNTRARKGKAFSLLMAVLLAMQLLPLNMVSAAEDTPGTESLSASVTPFAIGADSGPATDITGTKYLNIHGTTGDRPTVIILTASGMTIDPDSDGNYKNIPADATIELRLAFDLSDGDEDAEVQYQYDGSEQFEFQLPLGINWSASGTGGNINVGDTSNSMATWSISSTGLLEVQFNNTIVGQTGIWGRLLLDGTFLSLDSGGEDTSVTLGEKTITFTREKPAASATVNKTAGVYNAAENTIEWTVTVTPTPNLPTNPLSGYKLEDVLTGSHTYAADSFQVGGSGIADDDVNLSISTDKKTITYTFPDGASGVQTVQYKTTPDGGTNLAGIYKNTATLKDSNDVFVNKATAQKSIGADEGSQGSFFRKTGSKVSPLSTDPTNDSYMKWTVTVDIPAVPGGTYLLPDAKIIDHLAQYLKLVTDSASPYAPTLTKKTGNSTETIADGTIDTTDPTDGFTYSFPSGEPNTGSTYTLTYYTYVAPADYDAVFKSDSVVFNNKAEFTWTPGSGSGSGTPITIGYTVSKSLVASGGLLKKEVNSLRASSYDNAVDAGFIQWKLTVNGNGASLNSAVIEDAVQIPDDHKLVISNEKPLIVMKNDADPIEYTSISLSGTHGTLSDITDSAFKFAFTSPGSDTYTITYWTKLTDTALAQLYANGTKSFTNRATLSVDGDTITKYATKTFGLELLKKDNGAHDYSTNETTWSIHVNSNKMLLTNAVITDTIPEGMTLVNGSVAVAKVTDKTTTPWTTAPLTEGSTGNYVLTSAAAAPGNGGTFTVNFKDDVANELLITYKTKLDDGFLKDSGNWNGVAKQAVFENKVSLTSDQTSGVTTQSTVTVKNPAVGKTWDYDGKSEIVTWTAVINQA